MLYKYCPFCGGNQTKLVSNRTLCGHNGLDDPVFRHRAYVRCMKCNARGPLASGRIMFVKYDLPEWAEDPGEINKRAVDAWNKSIMGYVVSPSEEMYERMDQRK